MTSTMSELVVALVTSLPLVGCAYKPWTPHSTVDAKPASPLRAPASRATLVVIVSNAQRAGNGAYTVFEGREPLAQVDETLAAWSSVEVEPGPHRFYVRTWASAFCRRLDATLVAGKVYVINLNGQNTDHPALFGSNGNIGTSATFLVNGQHTAAGALYFLPHVTLDVAAARRELQEHGSQLEECVASADKTKEDPPAHADIGFDAIDFARGR